MHSLFRESCGFLLWKCYIFVSITPRKNTKKKKWIKRKLGRYNIWTQIIFVIYFMNNARVISNLKKKKNNERSSYVTMCFLIWFFFSSRETLTEFQSDCREKSGLRWWCLLAIRAVILVGAVHLFRMILDSKRSENVLVL